MKVEIFNLCDFASVDAGGKLNVMGIFNSMWAREKPILYGLCALAIRLRFEKLEEGLKTIRLAFVDADGNPVMPVIETQIRVQIPPMASSGTAHLVSIIPQLRLPSFGEYSIDLAVDGRQEGSTPFYAHQLPATPPHLQKPPPMG